MKYFKTNTGRIWRFSDFYKNDIMVDCYISRNRLLYYHKKDIIAQADTIEELCDEFVVATTDNDITQIFHRYKDATDFKMDIRGCHAKVYGAIWTDEGLIYVAKMNDKGELELL